MGGSKNLFGPKEFWRFSDTFFVHWDTLTNQTPSRHPLCTRTHQTYTWHLPNFSLVGLIKLWFPLHVLPVSHVSSCTCCQLHVSPLEHVASCTCCQLHVLPIVCVTSCTCCQLHLLLVARVANCMCCQLHVLPVACVASWTCCQLHVLPFARIASWMCCWLQMLPVACVASCKSVKLKQKNLSNQNNSRNLLNTEISQLQKTDHISSQIG